VFYGAETPPRSRAEMEALAALPNIRSVRLPRGKLAVHEEFPDATAPRPSMRSWASRRAARIDCAPQERVYFHRAALSVGRKPRSSLLRLLCSRGREQLDVSTARREEANFFPSSRSEPG
jgi:hypothetical protein